MYPSHGATLLHATKLHHVTVPLGGINVDSNRFDYKLCSYLLTAHEIWGKRFEFTENWQYVFIIARYLFCVGYWLVSERRHAFT